MTSPRLEQLSALLLQRGEDPFLRYAQLLEFIRLERREDALEALQLLLDRHPDYLGTYYSAAKYLEQQQEPERAASLYQQGLALARRLGDHKTAAELQAALEQLES